MQQFTTVKNQSKSILSYILSFIGFDRLLSNTITAAGNDELSSTCSFLTDSTFFVAYDNKNNVAWENPWTIQSWINDLSRVALCQIVTAAVLQYPAVADIVLQTCHASWDSQDEIMRELYSLQQQSRCIAHSLDNHRPSEQFARASEISEEMRRMTLKCTQVLRSLSSLAVLFGLIIVAEEGLSSPPEVRKHMFYQAKFGRTVVLDMSTALKNYKHSTLSPSQRSALKTILGQDSWIDKLAEICSKMSTYDDGWDFRQEYENVVSIAKQYA
ncbi:hypothetical protein DFQ30_005435 [Apophysomyces sp. BC1015]|nr:hypothetical protein DFQ30_005435 [Apophysomyces sp. BC1015]KAG0177818.1 hypothetical protein DFQ29_004304 [Apophysomyces sp. BC1021]